MKKRNLFYGLVCMLAVTSCNYLDFDETNGLQTKEDIYKYMDRTEFMVNHVYSFILQDFGTIGGAMRDCATDDAEFANTGASVQDFNNGAWSALNTLDDQWDNLYAGIRAANNFMVDVENTDFSRYEYQNNYSEWMKRLSYHKDEARLLRAYFFFELARRYGDIAMPTTALTAEEANAIGKTPFLEVIQFIADECDAVAPNLPVTYQNVPSRQIGRVTKGFAMALKAKALLYAASELHNPSGDVEAWKSAARAALVLIDSAEVRGWYTLDGALTAIDDDASKEIVLYRQNGNSSSFELTNFPVRFTDGGSTTTGVCPSQNLVDAFETVNGYTVTLVDNVWVCDDPEFDPAHPYANRDPRLGKTVLTDGADFKGTIIETFNGGQDAGAVATGGTATGYFLRKYIRESTSFDPNALVTNKHTYVVYRYAEALLSYAEAMTEAFGNPDYTDATFTRSARWALNQVRANAGMPEVTATGKEDFLERVRNEWRVEFAFEDHRFWDIRRWNIGSQTQTELYRVGIEVQTDGSKSYSKQLYEMRTWNDRMNLYPIPQEELFKNNNLAPQNSGW